MEVIFNHHKEPSNIDRMRQLFFPVFVDFKKAIKVDTIPGLSVRIYSQYRG